MVLTILSSLPPTPGSTSSSIVPATSTTSPSVTSSFETSSNGKKRPVSLGNEVVEYTLPRELNYPFGAYEFALPDTFDSMLYDAMSHCLEYEEG